MSKEKPDARRRLPSIDVLLRSDPGQKAATEFGRAFLTAMLRQALAEARTHMRAGEGFADGGAPTDDALLGRAVALAARAAFGLTPLINATGVVLHTGLGRAPLPPEAAAAAAAAGSSYTDLEVDRDTGLRGKRSWRAEAMLTAITGAEAALIVNNGAAALLLSLAAMAKGKQVPVSRGELIEIGGEFRLPDIVSASGAKLVEVGTTNRTRLKDYREAISSKTGALLKVHPSNYRVVGFTQSPTATQLAELAAAHDLPFLYDVGSGLLHRGAGVPKEEPAVDEALQAGADLVIFSGDKLLGGPQAGIVVGSAALIERLRRHPIARAVRVDKMQIAALESVLATIARGERGSLPVWQMLREDEKDVHARAKVLARNLHGELEGASVVKCDSVVGGGSLPGYGVPSWAVRLDTPEPEAFAAHLRMGSPPVFCRVTDGAIMFDLRTVPVQDVDRLTRAITYAMESDPGRDED